MCDITSLDIIQGLPDHYKALDKSLKAEQKNEVLLCLVCILKESIDDWIDEAVFYMLVKYPDLDAIREHMPKLKEAFEDFGYKLE